MEQINKLRTKPTHHRINKVIRNFMEETCIGENKNTEGEKRLEITILNADEKE